MSDPRVEELLAKQEIQELAYTYSRGLDRLDASLLHSVFSSDAYCEYGFYNGAPAEFIEFAITEFGQDQSDTVNRLQASF